MEVIGHERVVDDLYALDHVVALGNQLPPAAPLGVPGVDRDHALARGVEIGEDVEHGPVVADEPVARVELVQQSHDLALDARVPRVFQIEIVDAVPPIGAEPHGHHGVATVVGDVGAEAPIRLVRPLVHQDVLGLVGAEPVIIEPLESVHVGECLVPGLGIAAVEESRAVLGPRGARKLDPLQVIRQVAPARHVAHAELLPVRPARRGPVGEAPPVFGHRQRRDGHGAVFGEQVGIEQRLGAGREGSLLVQHRLVLQPVVLEKEVAPRLVEWRAVLRIVPERRQALAERRPLRDLREIALGEPVLGIDPAPRFGGIGVLEPAIGVGDPRAVIVVDYIALAGRRVRERLRGHGAAEQDASQDQTPGEVMSKWGAHSALISGLLT